jgi:transposase
VVAERTALINYLRALLLERGIIAPKGRKQLEVRLVVFADEGDIRLSPRMRRLIDDLRAEWHSVDERVAAFDAEFLQMSHADEAARLLAEAGELTLDELCIELGSILNKVAVWETV